MKIIVNSGKGRPKNPYPPVFKCNPEINLPDVRNSEYDNFEQSVQYHEAPGIPNGEYEGYLQWQNQFWNLTLEKSRWDNVDQPDLAIPHKQIWVINSQKE